MRMTLKLVGLALVLVVALAALLGVRAALMPSRQVVVAPVVPAPVDAQAAAQRLGAAVRFRTLATVESRQPEAAAFEGLRAFLETSFPAVHATLQRELVGEHTLVYTWVGSDTKAPGIGLLAHQDVAPIAPGTEGDWKQPPFSGAVADGFIWGRGAWDNKGNLMSMLEAMEGLVRAGFRPSQTVYLVLGHDEEVGGGHGAAEVARLFKQRGIRIDWMIDEGPLITEGMIGGLSGPAALVGLAEKGFMTLQLTATVTPGHSSMPPTGAEQSAIGILSAALARLERHPMPARIDGLAREMYETLAPELSGVNRLLLSNLWLLRPLVAHELLKGPSTAAMLRTTTALTLFNAGVKENVMPGVATASVNFRMLPGDSSEAVVAHVQRVIDNPAVAITRAPWLNEASRVAPTEANGYRQIEKTLRQLHVGMVVAPGMMLGGSDSRLFEDVAAYIYKFSPVRATADDLKRFHGTNERISIANYVEMIQFYRQLLVNTVPAP
jgi:carboxypeptidase PM20D1